MMFFVFYALGAAAVMALTILYGFWALILAAVYAVCMVIAYGGLD